MDVHPYVAFDEGMNAAPLAVPAADRKMGGTWPSLACRRWGSMTNRTYVPTFLIIPGSNLHDGHPTESLPSALPLQESFQVHSTTAGCSFAKWGSNQSIHSVPCTTRGRNGAMT